MELEAHLVGDEPPERVAEQSVGARLIHGPHQLEEVLRHLRDGGAGGLASLERRILEAEARLIGVEGEREGAEGEDVAAEAR